ncbi:hypothetical protein EJB05_45916, partial [Eragrostis curvula]
MRNTARPLIVAGRMNAGRPQPKSTSEKVSPNQLTTHRSVSGMTFHSWMRRPAAASASLVAIHQRPYKLVIQYGNGIGNSVGGGTERAGDDGIHLGHCRRADNGVAEVAVRERRSDAGAGGCGHVQPRVLCSCKSARQARTTPHMSDHCAERGGLLTLGAALERVNLASGNGEDGSFKRDLWFRPAAAAPGVHISVVETHGGRRARAEQRAVEPRARHPGLADAPRDGSPRVQEVGKRAAVGRQAMEGRAHAHRAALEERRLRAPDQDAGVFAVRRGAKHPPHLIRRDEVAHLVEGGINAGGDEEHPVAGAPDLLAAGAVLRQPTGEGVERDERLGQGSLQDVRREAGGRAMAGPVS